MRTFDDYLDYIYGLGSSGDDYSLESIRRLMDFFDRPQDKIKTIHIAGTNGKGSTAKMLLASLEDKYKVGIFTSPYMERINEEISISGLDISDEDFMGLIDRLRPFIDRLLKEGYKTTYFEAMTAMAYLYFYENSVDLAIIEVGLGGRLDSTNIIKKPLASVITSISKDHTKVLGSTLKEIASNKAGIIKEGSPVFVYPQKPEAMDVIEAEARLKDSDLYTFDKDELIIKYSSPRGNIFSFRDFNDVKLSLRGGHQAYNASLAIMVLDYLRKYFDIADEDIRKGLKKAYNPGRLDIIRQEPLVMVDGSHNIESISALIDALEEFSYKRLIVGFSILKDKDHKEIIEKIGKLSDKLIITYIGDNPRAMDPRDIEAEANDFINDIEIIEDNKLAYERSLELAGSGDLVLWCGSLYLVGKILSIENGAMGKIS